MGAMINLQNARVVGGASKMCAGQGANAASGRRRVGMGSRRGYWSSPARALVGWERIAGVVCWCCVLVLCDGAVV